MPFKKGVSGNKDGKPKGAQAKTTKKARELFIEIMEGEVCHIKQALEKVRKESPEDYLNLLSKFYPYFIPKKVDLTSDDKPITTIKVVREN